MSKSMSAFCLSIALLTVSPCMAKAAAQSSGQVKVLQVTGMPGDVLTEGVLKKLNSSGQQIIVIPEGPTLPPPTTGAPLPQHPDGICRNLTEEQRRSLGAICPAQ